MGAGAPEASLLMWVCELCGPWIACPLTAGVAHSLCHRGVDWEVSVRNILVPTCYMCGVLGIYVKWRQSGHQCGLGGRGQAVTEAPLADARLPAVSRAAATGVPR